MSSPAVRAAALLGTPVSAVRPLHGGDLSEVLRVEFEDGRVFAVKTGPAPRIEASMLEAVRASGAPAPAVVAVDDAVLILELLADDGRLRTADASLGEAAARLHAACGQTYGWPQDFAFGRLAIDNGPCDTWPEFWSRRRLLPHLAFLPPELARRIEALARELPNRLPQRPPPALLHGDLWSGNVLAAGGRVSGLIDPACYHGDAEVDLAMLHLFGAPGPAFGEAYGGLPPGWAERRPIYSLWPALVHLRLFGSGYRSLVERFLSQCGV